MLTHIQYKIILDFFLDNVDTKIIDIYGNFILNTLCTLILMYHRIS